MRFAAALTAAGLLLITLVAAGVLPAGHETLAQSTTTIRVGDFWFCDPAGPQPCAPPHDTAVNVGDTVVWEWGPGGAGTGAPHTTTHCADNFTSCSGPREWDSSPAMAAGTFSHTFGPEDAGQSFLYLCQLHPVQMRGAITVLAAQPSPSPQPSPTPSSSPPATATPAPVQVQPRVVPVAGGAPPAEGGQTPLWPAVAAGGLLIASAAVALRRLRR